MMWKHCSKNNNFDKLDERNAASYRMSCGLPTILRVWTLRQRVRLIGHYLEQLNVSPLVFWPASPDPRRSRPRGKWAGAATRAAGSSHKGLLCCQTLGRFKAQQADMRGAVTPHPPPRKLSSFRNPSAVTKTPGGTKWPIE